MNHLESEGISMNAKEIEGTQKVAFEKNGHVGICKVCGKKKIVAFGYIGNECHSSICWKDYIENRKRYDIRHPFIYGIEIEVVRK
jgi:hypothetical protein